MIRFKASRFIEIVLLGLSLIPLGLAFPGIIQISLGLLAEASSL